MQSPGDRTALRVIGQKRRTVVSGRTEKMKGFEDQPDQMSMMRRAAGGISTMIRNAIVFVFSGLTDDIIHFTEIDFDEMDFGEINLGEIHFGILEALMGMVFRCRTVELGVLNKKFRQQG